MVDRAGFENLYGSNVIEGSNPSLSAIECRYFFFCGCICYHESMSNIYTLGLALLVMLALYVIFILFSQKNKLPYYKNPNFISYSERSFYKILDSLVPQNYYIFPQVSLNSLLKVDKQGKEYWQYINKIKQKSVDFVIVAKDNFDPKLVIELDDFFHNYQSRIERDEFVNEALNEAEIKYLRIKGEKSYNLDKLKIQILEKLK